MYQVATVGIVSRPVVTLPVAKAGRAPRWTPLIPDAKTETDATRKILNTPRVTPVDATRTIPKTHLVWAEVELAQ